MKPNREKFTQKDLVIFDLCGTLYESNTTFDFLDFYFQNNKDYAFYRSISKAFFVKALNKITTSLFGWDFIRLYGVSFLKGKKQSEVLHSFKNFNTYVLSTKEIQVATAMVEEAKTENSKLILMSASLDFIVQDIAQELHITEFYATQLQCKNGVYTGKIKKDLLGSKHHLVKNIRKNYKNIIFITDNISDINVISHVDKFFVISKHKHLNFWKKVKGVSGIYEI